jgi:hypothetical protein
MTEDTVKCQLCGRKFRALGSHLHRTHGMSGAEYRAEFDLPASYPLAADDLRDAQRKTIRVQMTTGTLTYDHLPAATDAAKKSGRGKKCGADICRQREIARQIGASNTTNDADAVNPRGRKYGRERENLRRWRGKGGAQ